MHGSCFHNLVAIKNRFNLFGWSLKWSNRVTNLVVDAAAEFSLSNNCRLFFDEFSIEKLPACISVRLGCSTGGDPCVILLVEALLRVFFNAS